MRKLLLGLTLCCVTVAMQAQDLISKIPSNAAIVATINGKNITDLLSIKQFEKSLIGKNIVKELSRESNGEVTSLDALGIDFSASFYYFLEAEKGVFSNYILIPLNGSEGFMNMMPEYEKEKIITNGDVSFLQENYNGTIIMWNKKMLLFVFSTDINKDDNSYDYGSVEAVKETVIESVEEETEEVVEETAIESVEEETEEVVEEIIIETTEVEDDDDYYRKQKERREKERKEREVKRKAKQERIGLLNLKKATAIMSGSYANNSILKNKKYRASIGKENFEAHVWVGDFLQIYKQALLDMPYSFKEFSPLGLYNIDALYKGTSITSTLNFEKNNVSVNLDYTMSKAMANHTKAIYNGKMNKDFFKYFNEDKMLGYIAVNASTEGLLTEYPKLIESLFVNSEKKDLAQIVPLATELLSIFLDEEAIAELVRGDMLFVINDITKKQVTYTTYDYDEDYNRVSVEKTKEETVPDFIFMATSKGESIFNKLMKISDVKREVEFKDGIYKIKTPKNIPLNLYLMYKNDVLFLGTSEEHLIGIKNGTYSGNVSSKHKKNITKNATMFYLNGKKLVSQIPVDEMPREFSDKLDFIVENTEDVIFKTSKVEGTTVKSTFIISTPTKGHKNSFVYFMNMIDSLMQ